MGNSLAQKHNAKSLLLFALPTIVMMVFMSMYIMIDGIFVANFVSPDALAGLNLVVPFTNILASAAVLVGAGGSVVISRKLGGGKDKEAKEEFSAIVLMTVLFGAVVTVLGVIFADPILKLLGTPDSLYHLDSVFDPAPRTEHTRKLILKTMHSLLAIWYRYSGLINVFCVITDNRSRLVIQPKHSPGIRKIAHGIFMIMFHHMFQSNVNLPRFQNITQPVYGAMPLSQHLIDFRALSNLILNFSRFLVPISIRTAEMVCNTLVSKIYLLDKISAIEQILLCPPITFFE